MSSSMLYNLLQCLSECKFISLLLLLLLLIFTVQWVLRLSKQLYLSSA
jgi:hypothetical protein